MEITTYGALVAVILPLVGYLVFHRLALSRDRRTRYANACGEFRNALVKAIADVPNENSYWDNGVLENLPKVMREIAIAVGVFRPQVSCFQQKNFDRTWNDLKELVEKVIPKAHSREEVMYGGGQVTRAESRAKFHALWNQLANFAQKT